MKYEHYLLAGDCGGTNTRLQLIGLTHNHLSHYDIAEHRLPPGDVLKTATYLNEKFKNFHDILSQFLYAEQPVVTPLPSHAVLAAAGPVNGNKVLFTNNGWLISGDAILSTFGGSDGIQSAVLINDFVGCGYGALTVNHATECRKLNAAVAVPGAPIACVGAGTGLGECYLTTSTADPTSYTCFASEGGHAEFAPRSAVEFELLTFLRKKFGGNHRVSVERVVSGTGLANVYEFFAGRYPEKVAKEVHEEFLNAGSMQGKVVSVNAGKCEICSLSMKTFAGAYGSEVGVAGLKWIPRGGLYITGGLTPKNISWIEGEQSMFMQAFNDKGRVSELLEEVPLYAVMAEDLGLRGSHILAFKLLREDLARVEVSGDVRKNELNMLLAVGVGSCLAGGLLAAALIKKR